MAAVILQTALLLGTFGVLACVGWVTWPTADDAAIGAPGGACKSRRLAGRPTVPARQAKTIALW